MQMKSISSEPAPKGLKDVKHAEEGKATRLFLLLSDQSIQEQISLIFQNICFYCIFLIRAVKFGVCLCVFSLSVDILIFM